MMISIMPIPRLIKWTAPIRDTVPTKRPEKSTSKENKKAHLFV